MNTQHRDIITAIDRKQPITTSGVAEYLMDHFGYGGGMDFDAFRDQVSKTIGYLKSKGWIAGEDRPQTKGKPVRHWFLAYVPGSINDPTVNPEFFRGKPNESIVETWESDAQANADDASQTAAADAVSVSHQAEAQAGWAPEAIEHPDDVLDVLIQAIEKTAKKSTIPVSIAIA